MLNWIQQGIATALINHTMDYDSGDTVTYEQASRCEWFTQFVNRVANNFKQGQIGVLIYKMIDMVK